jgi:hypothetical protein
VFFVQGFWHSPLSADGVASTIGKPLSVDHPYMYCASSLIPEFNSSISSVT